MCRLAVRASWSIRCEPIHDHRAAARLASPEPDHLVRGDPHREREQLLNFKLDPREAGSIALARIAQALTELQREQLSSRQACETSGRKQPIDTAKDRQDSTFAARSGRMSEPSQGGRRWSTAARHEESGRTHHPLAPCSRARQGAVIWDERQGLTHRKL